MALRKIKPEEKPDVVKVVGNKPPQLLLYYCNNCAEVHAVPVLKYGETVKFSAKMKYMIWRWNGSTKFPQLDRCVVCPRYRRGNQTRGGWHTFVSHYCLPVEKWPRKKPKVEPPKTKKPTRKSAVVRKKRVK